MLYNKQGKNIYEIADILGSSKSSVYRKIVEFGLTDKITERKDVSKKLIDRIENEYLLNGKSITELSKIYNICSVSIGYWFKKRGINIRNLREACLLKSKETCLNSDYFDFIDTEEKCYWLGFLLADGNINSRIDRVSIRLKEEDGYHLEKFSKIFGKDIKYYVCHLKKTDKCYDGYGCEIDNSYLAKSVNKLGIHPRKSLSDDITIFDNIPDKYINHFIRGYFDGDGHIGIDKKYNMLKFCLCGSFGVLNKIKEVLMLKIGVKNNKICQGNTKIHTISWSGEGAYKIFKWLYKDSTLHLGRKRKIYDEFMGAGNLTTKGKLRKYS